MTIERLRAAYSARPFRPFIIHLADGRAIPVHHREFIMTLPSGHTVIVCQPDDSMHILDLPLVTRLEFNAAGAKRAKRTQPKTKKPLTKDAFDQHLLEIGLMSHLPETDADFDDPDDEPTTIKGEPLSETVIRERR